MAVAKTSLKIPLFPNSSYFLALGAGPTEAVVFKSVGRQHGIPVICCPNLNDFEAVFTQIAKVTGVVLLARNLSSHDLAVAKARVGARAIAMRVLEFAPTKVEIENAVDEIVMDLVPKGLGLVFTEAAQRIFPHFIEKFPPLKPRAKVPAGFERQIHFSLSANDLVGQGILRFKPQDFAVHLAEPVQGRAVEVLQEAMNQCLGLIVQKMVKIGIHATTGLPTVFDTSAIPALQSLVFFPSTHLMDDKATVAVSLGFFDLSGAKLSFEGIEMQKDTDGVEFL